MMPLILSPVVPAEGDACYSKGSLGDGKFDRAN